MEVAHVLNHERHHVVRVPKRERRRTGGEVRWGYEFYYRSKYYGGFDIYFVYFLFGGGGGGAGGDDRTCANDALSDALSYLQFTPFSKLLPPGTNYIFIVYPKKKELKADIF